MDTLINLYQHGCVREAQMSPQPGKSVTDQMQAEIDDLKRKTDALTIACQALWELVCAQTGANNETILRKMQEIDARDGRVDGKITLSLAECPQCGRKSNANRGSCLYCGTRLKVQHVF